MDRPVVNIQIAGMVSIYRIGQMLLDQPLDYLNDIEQRHGIESIVGKVVQHDFSRSESSADVVRGPAYCGLCLCVVSRWRIVTGDNSFTENCNDDVSAFVGQPADSSARTEHFVVGCAATTRTFMMNCRAQPWR